MAVTSQNDIVGVTSSASFDGVALSSGNRTNHDGKDIFAITPLANGLRVFYFIGGSDDDVATCAYANSSHLLIGYWTRSTDFVQPGGFGGEGGFLLIVPRGQFVSSTQIATERLGGSGDDRINALSLSAGYFVGETRCATAIGQGDLHQLCWDESSPVLRES